MAKTSVFNSPLEMGTRVVVLLCAAYPMKFDIQKILFLDYLMIHSGDAGGPESLHTPVPQRSGELLVKQDLLRRGIYLMISRGLIVQSIDERGIEYYAEDRAAVFVSSLTSEYYRQLSERASWTIEFFGNLNANELDTRTRSFLEKWTVQFQSIEK